MFSLCRCGLMAENKDVDEMLRIVSEYDGREWGLKFSSHKCKVMQLNDNRNNQWVLGDYVLEVVEKYTYLGMQVSGEGIGGDRQRAINEGKARRAAGMRKNEECRLINKYEV